MDVLSLMQCFLAEVGFEPLTSSVKASLASHGKLDSPQAARVSIRSIRSRFLNLYSSTGSYLIGNYGCRLHCLLNTTAKTLSIPAYKEHARDYVSLGPHIIRQFL